MNKKSQTKPPLPSSSILIVEDDPALGESLVERLQKEGYLVEWKKNLSQAKSHLAQNRPDLVVLDLRLPDGSGFDLAKELLGKETSPPFLFLTAHAGAPERLKGFELGAHDFIPKPFHLQELLLRLRNLLQSRVHQPISTTQWGQFTIDWNRFCILDSSGETTSLSLRDMGLLRLLVTHQNRTVSRDEILDKVWGEESFPTARTVDNCIVNLRKILGKSSILSVRGIGYRFQPPTN